MAVKIIQPTDLHPDDFNVDGGVVRVVVVRQQFTLTWASGVSSPDNNPERRKVTIQSGLGIIHLDFTRTSLLGGVIATLPSACPTPQSLLEVQLHDGGQLWIEAGGRTINSSGLTRDRRYIVDMVGFFNE